MIPDDAVNSAVLPSSQALMLKPVIKEIYCTMPIAIYDK